MKYLLIVALLIFAPAAASAQTIAEINAAYPSSQTYGWFRTEAWAVDRMLAEPGYKQAAEGKSDDGWEYVLFTANDGSGAVAFHLLGGSVGGVTFSFASKNPEGKAWHTASMEQVGPNEWIHRSANARIKRHYSGSIVSYRVDYEPFAKD